MNKNLTIIAVVLVALTGWMLSGVLKEDILPPPKERVHRTTVRVRRSVAQRMHKEIRFTGHTVPGRRVTLHAQTTGMLISLGAEEGDTVEEGEVLAVIDLQDRQEKVYAAKASLKQLKIEFEAAHRLFEKGLQSESQYSQALAAMRQAQAQLKALELDLKNTHIFAPFSGILETRPVEIGDYIDRGKTVIGTLIELNPLKVEGFVTEREVGGLKHGMPCTLEGPSGEAWEGTVSYISQDADLASRTFRVEVLLDNEDATLPAGLTVDVRVASQEMFAHAVTPSLLSLDDKGLLGVKTVDEHHTVHFYPAQLVRAEQDRVWLGGLPEDVRIISVGHGFAQAGDSVLTQDEDAS